MTPIQWSTLAFCLALPLSIAGTNAGAAALSASALAFQWKTRTLSWSRAATPALTALAAYLLVALISSALGIDPTRSFRFFYKDLHKAWILLLLVPALKVCRRGPLLGALAAASAGACLVGIWQSATERDPFSHAWVRAHAFVHPVTFGEQAALALLGALCFANRREAGTTSAWTRRAGVLLIALAGAALALSQTRAAMVGLAAGFAAVCAVDATLRRRAPWVAAAAAAGLLGLEFSPTGRSFTRTLHTFNQGYSDLLTPQLERIYLWDVALKAFKDHPFFGVGPDNFVVVFSRYFPRRLEGEISWGSAHNLYLHQLAERGAAGLLALLAFLYALLDRALRRSRENPNAWNLWALASLSAFLVMNLTEVSFQTEQVATLVLFSWAWAEASHEVPAEA